MNNDESHSPQRGVESSLTEWVESILLGMNLLLTILGAVLIIRFRKVSLDMFEDFDVQLTQATEIALSLPFATLLPSLGLIALAVRFLSDDIRRRTFFHIAHFLVILIIAAFFVGTTLPALQRLLNNIR